MFANQHTFNFNGISELYQDEMLTNIKKDLQYFPDYGFNVGLIFNYKSLEISSTYYPSLSTLRFPISANNVAPIINADGTYRRFINFETSTPGPIHYTDEYDATFWHNTIGVSLIRHLSIGLFGNYSNNKIYDKLPPSNDGIVYFDSLKIKTLQVTRQNVGLQVNYTYPIFNHINLSFGINYSFYGKYRVQLVREENQFVEYNANFMAASLALHYRFLKLGYYYQYWRTKQKQFSDTYHFLTLQFQLTILKLPLIFEEL